MEVAVMHSVTADASPQTRATTASQLDRLDNNKLQHQSNHHHHHHNPPPRQPHLSVEEEETEFAAAAVVSNNNQQPPRLPDPSLSKAARHLRQPPLTTADDDDRVLVDGSLQRQQPPAKSAQPLVNGDPTAERRQAEKMVPTSSSMDEVVASLYGDDVDDKPTLETATTRPEPPTTWEGEEEHGRPTTADAAAGIRHRQRHHSVGVVNHDEPPFMETHRHQSQQQQHAPSNNTNNHLVQYLVVALTNVLQSIDDNKEERGENKEEEAIIISLPWTAALLETALEHVVVAQDDNSEPLARQTQTQHAAAADPTFLVAALAVATEEFGQYAQNAMSTVFSLWWLMIMGSSSASSFGPPQLLVGVKAFRRAVLRQQKRRNARLRQQQSSARKKKKKKTRRRRVRVVKTRQIPRRTVLSSITDYDLDGETFDKLLQDLERSTHVPEEYSDWEEMEEEEEEPSIDRTEEQALGIAVSSRSRPGLRPVWVVNLNDSFVFQGSAVVFDHCRPHGNGWSVFVEHRLRLPPRSRLEENEDDDFLSAADLAILEQAEEHRLLETDSSDDDFEYDEDFYDSEDVYEYFESEDADERRIGGRAIDDNDMAPYGVTKRGWFQSALWGIRSMIGLGKRRREDYYATSTAPVTGSSRIGHTSQAASHAEPQPVDIDEDETKECKQRPPRRGGKARFFFRWLWFPSIFRHGQRASEPPSERQETTTVPPNRKPSDLRVPPPPPQAPANDSISSSIRTVTDEDYEGSQLPIEEADLRLVFSRESRWSSFGRTLFAPFQWLWRKATPPDLEAEHVDKIERTGNEEEEDDDDHLVSVGAVSPPVSREELQELEEEYKDGDEDMILGESAVASFDPPLPPPPPLPRRYPEHHPQPQTGSYHGSYH